MALSGSAKSASRAGSVKRCRDRTMSSHTRRLCSSAAEWAESCDIVEQAAPLEILAEGAKSRYRFPAENDIEQPDDRFQRAGPKVDLHRDPQVNEEPRT